MAPERGEIEGRPLRGVFEAGDAWLDTGDLVRRDADGDFWLVDHLGDLISSAAGGIPTIPIEDTLCAELDFIDLCAVYGVREDGLDHDQIVAAITVRPDRFFDGGTFGRVVRTFLPSESRPTWVRVLDELPRTAGYRIRKGPLKALGLESGRDRLYRLDERRATYRDRSPENRRTPGNGTGQIAISTPSPETSS